MSPWPLGYNPGVSAFDAAILEIPPVVRAEMEGCSWKPDPRCPSFDELRLIRARHRGFDGVVRDGELVVAAAVAADVAWVLGQVFAAGYPIERMVRVDAYGGDDAASMAANNSSGFNFRMVLGTNELSRHALGLAVDINPLQNPYLVRGQVLPPLGRAYIDRSNLRPGMLARPSPVIEAFDAIGWEWGGDFKPDADYHHFAARADRR